MKPSQLSRVATWLLVGLPIGLIWLIIWSGLVKTSPTTDDTVRVRGWESVLRELPATVPFVAVGFLGMLVGTVVARSGEVSSGMRAVKRHAIALVVVLGFVFGGSADNIMTTRSASVKWLLFPIEVGIPLGCCFLAKSSVARAQHAR